MNLVVDIGNTSIKVALFNKKEFISEKKFNSKSEAIDYVLSEKTEKGIFSSVKNDNTAWEEIFKSFAGIHFMPSTRIPVLNSYTSPSSLGMDRLAAVIGGHSLFPNKDILSIDCGTCITYDMLKKNCFEGGAISPGINIKYKALHNFTDNLPLVEKDSEKVELIGKDTTSSIKSGVINGTIMEINKTIEEYKRINNNLAVILSGGDSFLLQNNIINVDLVEPRLVLIGLNEILEYNT